MGYRAYVIKAGSKNKHTGAEFFNWRACEILDLFDNHNIEYDNDFRPFREKWTVNATDLNRLITILEESPNEVDKCFSEDMSKAYTNQELANCFKHWVEEADKETGLIRIHWS
jgi:hypothetical protein